MHIITLIFVLFLQTIFFQVAIPNLILCFGKDGHIAFEWLPEDDDCTPGNPINHILFSGHEQEYREIPEVDCTDINLHWHPASAEKRQNQRHLLTQVKTYVSIKVLTRENKSHLISYTLQHKSPSDPIIETVQGTVLLI